MEFSRSLFPNNCYKLKLQYTINVTVESSKIAARGKYINFSAIILKPLSLSIVLMDFFMEAIDS